VSDNNQPARYAEPRARNQGRGFSRGTKISAGELVMLYANTGRKIFPEWEREKGRNGGNTCEKGMLTRKGKNVCGEAQAEFKKFRDL